MTPAKIIKANLWVDPAVGIPHDERQVICFRKGRDPHKFLGMHIDVWYHEQGWPVDVDRWRDLPNDPVAPDALVDKPIRMGYPLSAFGVNLHIDSWFPHLDWGYVRESQMQHDCWEVCLRDGVLSLSQIIRVVEFIWQQRNIGVLIEWVINGNPVNRSNSHKKFKYFRDGSGPVWRECNCEKGMDH